MTYTQPIAAPVGRHEQASRSGREKRPNPSGRHSEKLVRTRQTFNFPLSNLPHLVGWVGNDYTSVGELDKALEYLHQAQAIDPEIANLYQVEAETYFNDVGDSEAAIAPALHALQLDPNDWIFVVDLVIFSNCKLANRCGRWLIMGNSLMRWQCCESRTTPSLRRNQCTVGGYHGSHAKCARFTLRKRQLWIAFPSPCLLRKPSPSQYCVLLHKWGEGQRAVYSPSPRLRNVAEGNARGKDEPSLGSSGVRGCCRA